MNPFSFTTLRSAELSLALRQPITTFVNGSLAVTSKSRKYWNSKLFHKTQVAFIVVKTRLSIVAPTVMGRQLHASGVVMKPISDIRSIESSSGQETTLLLPGSGRLVYLFILGIEVFLAQGISLILARHLRTSYTARNRRRRWRLRMTLRSITGWILESQRLPTFQVRRSSHLP